MVIEPNEFISVNTVIESRDGIFDEKRFSSIPRPRNADLNHLEKEQNKVQYIRNDNVENNDVPQCRRSAKARKSKDFENDFFVYLVE